MRSVFSPSFSPVSRRTPGVRQLNPIRLTNRLALLAWLVAMVGCGTGTYNQKMSESLTQLEASSALTRMLHSTPTSLPNTGLQIQLPTLVTENAKSLAVARAKVPFVDLPGLAFAYQDAVDGNQFMIHFAMPASGTTTQEDLETQLVQAIAQTFSGAAWQDRTVQHPSGTDVSVRYLTCSGKQKIDAVEVDGRMDLYLYPTQSCYLLVAFRAPSGVGGGFFDAAKASVGSVSSAQ